jgi:hypothetical protein
MFFNFNFKKKIDSNFLGLFVKIEMPQQAQDVNMHYCML